MAKSFEIKIGDSENRVVNVYETTSREIEISGKVYTVPVGVVRFIEELADEIKTQQQRRVSTDKQIDDKINKRVDRMIKTLAEHHMLAQPLDAEYPLPKGVEVFGGDGWTFFQEARNVARKGLQNEYRDSLVDDIGSPYSVQHRK